MERVKRLEQHMEKMKLCMERFPEDPRVSSWERKAEEIRNSLDNLQKYGQEHIPNGLPDMVVGVPPNGG